MGLETGILPKVEKKGEKHPHSSYFPSSRSIWKLADFQELGDATCRGHSTLQSREEQWRDLGPDRPRTGSGRSENEMTILAWAVVEYFTDDRMLEGL